MKLLTFVTVLSSASCCSAYNILVFSPYPTWSQYIQMEPLFSALGLRGHNVTVVSPFPPKKEQSHFHHIHFVADLYWKIKFSAPTSLKDWIAEIKDKRLPIDFWKELPDASMPEILESSVFQDLIHNENKFDLVFMEVFFGQEPLVILGHLLDAPVVAFATFGHMPDILRYMGAPNAVAYLSHFNVDYAGSLSLTQRLENAWIHYRTMLYDEYWYYPQHDAVLAKYFPGPLPSISDMLRNISLFFLTANTAVDGAKIYPPNVIELPVLHLKDPAPLDKELDVIMNNAQDGVIYFSFGSIVTPSILGEEETQIFLSVLKELNQTVLWKTDWNSTSHDIPKNVYTRDWFDQKSILAHPRCVLFLTHGGLSSLMEAINYAVPVVGMSVFGDQPKNLAYAEYLGYGLHIPHKDLTQNSLRRALRTVLQDSRFKENINRASKIFQDKPMSSLDTAIYWIEYAIRHKGAHHLKPLAVRMPWYQLFLLDIITVCFTIFVVLSYLMFKMISLLLRKYFTRSRPLKEKSN
ncbi:unnamed protein product [Bemisia tabaci]|nr:unnamed protein product [Bemisia tabaci]